MNCCVFFYAVSSCVLFSRRDSTVCVLGGWVWFALNVAPICVCMDYESSYIKAPCGANMSQILSIWLIITGFGFDDWIYWHWCNNYTRLQSLITAHNRWLPKARSISSWTTSVSPHSPTDSLSVSNSSGKLLSFYKPRENRTEITDSKGSTSRIHGNRAPTSRHGYASSSSNYTAYVALWNAV
jgi:hypothetical protein